MISNELLVDIENLINLAQKQDNKISLSLILITLKCSSEDIAEIISKFEEKGIEVVDERVEDEDDNIDSDLKVTPFDPSKIDIKMDKITIDSIIKRIKNKELEFDSSFQRKAGLWTQKQKSQLLESIFLKIPLPAFYFDASDDDKWQIIDGLQRISTIKEYVVEQSLKLTGLEFLKDLTGLKYNSLPRALQRRLEETNLNVYLVGSNTPKNVKFNIFKRINTGGLILEPQEIRNALYQGQATIFLSELAKVTEFKEATTYSIKSDRMLDREFCLRYVAFTEIDLEEYDGYIDNFLNNAMDYLGCISREKMEAIKEHFRRVMAVCYKLFDKNAFRRTTEYGHRGPVNKALFETWSKIISTMNNETINRLINRKETLKKKLSILMNDYYFQNAIRASDKTSIEKRLKQVQNIIQETLME